MLLSLRFSCAVLLTSALAGCSVAGEPVPEYGGSPSSSSSEPSTAAGAPAALPPLDVSGELASDLSVPWSMVALPDGSVLVSERDTGDIRRISDGTVTTIGTIDDAVEAGGEGGLLGLAIGPDFAFDQKLYAYYTGPTDNRVVTLDYSPQQVGQPEEVLTGIPRANIHNGGRIKFGPDGLLYIGTGDASDSASAQDVDSLGGKILRVTAEGEPATGNPFGDSPVYSVGHRNVQGLAWDSEGRLWASEFGPEVDDELNLIEPGGNYGWPEVTGAPGHEDFIDAQVVWPSTATSSPSGMAIVENVAYIGGLRGERLWQVPLDAGTAGQPISHFDGEFGRLRDVVQGNGGELWVATNEGEDSRILTVDVG